MHKKLFGLLATAVVGLTLTSCGGGGGGGGGGGESTTVGAGVQGAPNSVVGRTITQSFSNDVSSEKWEYTFTGVETFKCVVYRGNEPHMSFTGTYEYDRISDGEAHLRSVTYAEGDNLSAAAISNNDAGNWIGVVEDITLLFNAQTGQLNSADNQPASMR